MSPVRSSYEIVQPTQRYRRVGERWYRETVVRLADGSLRLYGIPA